MDTAVGVVQAYLELCGYFVLAELPVRGTEGGGREVLAGSHFKNPILGLFLLHDKVTRGLDMSV